MSNIPLSIFLYEFPTEAFVSSVNSRQRHQCLREVANLLMFKMRRPPNFVGKQTIYQWNLNFPQKPCHKQPTSKKNEALDILEDLGEGAKRGDVVDGLRSEDNTE
jgi:hypothetical protein